MSWSFPKTDIETNFLNLENRSLDSVIFLNRKYLCRYLTILYLLTYLILGLILETPIKRAQV